MQVIAYEDQDIETLLQKTAALDAGEPNTADEQEAVKPGNTLGPGLEQVIVRVWSDEKDLSVDADEEGMHRKCSSQIAFRSNWVLRQSRVSDYKENALSCL